MVLSDMPYNLLLLANDSYYKLLRISVASICKNCDMEKIGKIFIADLGLRDEHRNEITKLSKKISIVDTDANIGNSREVFSQNWIKAVSQKTLILRSLVENGNTPIVMIDSDTIIVKDFHDVLNPEYDIQLCKRASPLIRPDGLVVEYIASFVAINNANGINFITAWINRLEERVSQNMIPPHETPAMVETAQKNEKLKIGELDDKVVNCDNNYFPGITKIIHAKSRTANDSVSIFRFANIRNLPYNKAICLFNGSEKISFTIAFAFKKIISVFDLRRMLKAFFRKRF